MPRTTDIAIAVIGIDIGKNSFHIVGLDQRGAIVLRQKWSRGQVETRLANMPPCLIGMEACVGAHHLSRKLNALATSRGKRKRWSSVFPAHASTGDPNSPIRGLSANQIECALISMMARSDELHPEAGSSMDSPACARRN